jgi:hypothetical protein
VQFADADGNFTSFEVTATASSGGVTTLTVTFLGASINSTQTVNNIFDNNEVIGIQLYRAGNKGQKGEVGQKGQKGEKGINGQKGQKGEIGDKGIKGDKGQKGEIGDKGIKGEVGQKGEVGDKGAVGFKGETGQKGEQGDKGEVGDKGAPGADADNDAIAEDLSDSASFQLAVKGEKGSKGDSVKGEPGEFKTTGSYRVKALGVNKTTPSTGEIHASGDIKSDADVIAAASDARLKDISGNIENALEKVNSINGVEFYWNDLAKELMNRDTDKKEVGVIAQEIQEIMPELIAPAPGAPDYMTVRYERLTALLIEAVKELSAEVDRLKGL